MAASASTSGQIATHIRACILKCPGGCHYRNNLLRLWMQSGPAFQEVTSVTKKQRRRGKIPWPLLSVLLLHDSTICKRCAISCCTCKNHLTVASNFCSCFSKPPPNPPTHPGDRQIPAAFADLRQTLPRKLKGRK